MSNISIKNMDCMEALREMEDNQFDLAITSPPYNANMHCVNGRVVKRGSSKYAKKYEGCSDNLSMEEYYTFTKSVISELIRVSDVVFWNVQLLTGNRAPIMRAFGDLSDNFKELIVWDKGCAEPSINEGFLNSQFELIAVFSKDAGTRKFTQAEFDKGTVSNVWKIGKSRGVKGFNHKAAFPLQLPKKILSCFGKKGQKVIDPFIGTGTTAIACHDLGFDLTAFELDADYYASAVARLDKHRAQAQFDF